MGGEDGRVYVYNGKQITVGDMTGKCKSWVTPCPEEKVSTEHNSTPNWERTVLADALVNYVHSRTLSCYLDSGNLTHTWGQSTITCLKAACLPAVLVFAPIAEVQLDVLSYWLLVRSAQQKTDHGCWEFLEDSSPFYFIFHCLSFLDLKHLAVILNLKFQIRKVYCKTIRKCSTKNSSLQRCPVTFSCVSC